LEREKSTAGLQLLFSVTPPKSKFPAGTTSYYSPLSQRSARHELREEFNRSIPSEDVAKFSEPIAEFAEKMTTYSGSVFNPSEYGKQIVQRLLPTTLPYELGTDGAFDHASFNGRALVDDVMDVMLTLASNKPLGDV